MKCPKCGFTDEAPIKFLTHVMNYYVDKKTGKVDAVYNEDAAEITIHGITLVRQDLWKAPLVNPDAAPQVPQNNAPPTPPTRIPITAPSKES